MGSLSNFAENALLNHVANTAFTPATTLHVALCTADPTDTGSPLNEVANTNGYTRSPAITFGVAASRRVVQSGSLQFPQATGPWGTISHWAIMSTATHGAGDMYAYGNFVTPFAPVAGNTPTIPSSELEVEIGRTHYTATTISAVAPGTLNDSANNFPLFNVGSTLYISGFTGTPANNSSGVVVTSTASQITLSGITLVNDAAGESVRLSLSGGFTDYLVHNWLNRMFRNQAFAKPATYVALATSLIDDTSVIGGITEVTGGLYTRMQVNINGGAAPAWTVASTGALENGGAITFPTPNASWGLVRSMFLADAATAGNVLGYDNHSIAPQTPISGDTVQFAALALDLALS